MRTTETVQTAQETNSLEINVSETTPPECPHESFEIIGGATYDQASFTVNRCDVCGFSWEEPSSEVPNLAPDERQDADA